MPSTSPKHRSALLIDCTATLLHRLALSYTAETFPALPLLDLLETEALIALHHLPASRRTAPELAARLGLPVTPITAAVSRLRLQGCLRSTPPTYTLTPHGKARALAAHSTTHHLLRSLSQLKAETLQDLHDLLSKTLAARPHGQALHPAARRTEHTHVHYRLRTKGMPHTKTVRSVHPRRQP